MSSQEPRLRDAACIAASVPELDRMERLAHEAYEPVARSCRDEYTNREGNTMTKYTPEPGELYDTAGVEALTAAELLEIIARDGSGIARHVVNGGSAEEACGEWHLVSLRGHNATGGMRRVTEP